MPRDRVFALCRPTSDAFPEMPSMPPTPLTDISSLAWEHPADRAALNALRAIPGLDEVVRKVAGVFDERRLRHLFLANAIRVGPSHRPRLDALYDEALAGLDWPPSGRERPELYVTQTPLVNAAAIGYERPFIVVSSGALEILDADERRAILAHEVGHVMSEHATYRTLAVLLLAFGAAALPSLVGVAILPVHLAVMEWYRKSELSADRAAALATRDPRAVYSLLMKLAGGHDPEDAGDVDAFLRQAADYDAPTGAWDSVLKAFNTAFRDHPFATVRANELQQWVATGGHETILGGTYPKRGAPLPPLGGDVRAARDHYSEAARAAADTAGEIVRDLGDAAARAGRAFRDAFRGGATTTDAASGTVSDGPAPDVPPVDPAAGDGQAKSPPSTDDPNPTP